MLDLLQNGVAEAGGGGKQQVQVRAGKVQGECPTAAADKGRTLSGILGARRHVFGLPASFRAQFRTAGPKRRQKKGKEESKEEGRKEEEMQFRAQGSRVSGRKDAAPDNLGATLTASTSRMAPQDHRHPSQSPCAPHGSGGQS